LGRWNSKGQPCRSLGGELGTKKEALIVDKRDIESGKDKHLWLVGRWVIGGPT